MKHIRLMRVFLCKALDLFHIYKGPKWLKKLLWSLTVKQIIHLASVVFTYMSGGELYPQQIRGLVKQSAYKKISTDDKIPALRSPSKIMSSAILVSLWEYTVQELDWCKWRYALHPFLSPQQRFSRGRLVVFPTQRQITLYIPCVRRTVTVVWRESDSHLNTVVCALIPVVMETAELSKSVKQLKWLSVTKLIIRESASIQLRSHFTGTLFNTGVWLYRYSNNQETFAGHSLAFETELKMATALLLSLTQQPQLIVQTSSSSDLFLSWGYQAAELKGGVKELQK